MSSSEYNASDLFVKCLENEGVERIYGVPGEENLDLLESLRKSNIEIILTRHEQAAAFMAATYGRMTGKVGVAISTLGPGATNFTTAVAYAQLGGFPLLVITGQKPIRQSKQGRFQIIDTVGMMTPITKYSKQIVDPGMISCSVREAFRIAMEEKPGAVHLEFPEDISGEELADNITGVFPIAHTAVSEPNEEMIDKAIGMIKEAKLPLVLFGGACNRNDLLKSATNFIDTTGLPFFNTQMGKGVIAENNPNYIGTAALSNHDYLHEVVNKADLILSIGNEVVEKPAFFMLANGTKVIHINYHPAAVDNIYFPNAEVVGNIETTLNLMAKKLGKCNQNFDYAYKVRDFISAHISQYDKDDAFPIKPQKLVRDIHKVMAKDGYVALDNGMYKLWFARNYLTLRPNSLLLDNALGTMGAGLPVAMELSRMDSTRKVVAVVGDGGFMMNSQELETAVRLNLNVVVVILNDNAYGMIRWKQKGMGFDDYALTFNNPDFVAYANSYGATGHRLDKGDDLGDMIESCLSAKGVHVIDVPVDYSQNNKVLTEELQNKQQI